MRRSSSIRCLSKVIGKTSCTHETPKTTSKCRRVERHSQRNTRPGTKNQSADESLSECRLRLSSTLQNLAPAFFAYYPGTANDGKYLVAQHAANLTMDV